MESPIVEIDESTLDITALLNMGPMAPVANTHRIYTALRDEQPVFEIFSGAGSHAQKASTSFLITRYADVKSVLKDDVTYSSDINQRTMGIVMGPTIIGMDGREHLKHRTLITPSMTPRVLKDCNFQGAVRHTANSIIDNFAGKGVADLHFDFCFKYPLQVFVELLGLPPDDLDRVHHWGIALCLVAYNPEQGLKAADELLKYLTPLIQLKRDSPGPDMISMLVGSEINGDKLSDYEVVSFLRLLVLAGAETTNHLLGTMCYVLLQNPTLMVRVKNDRSLIPTLFNEAIRWESPIGTLMRETTVDTEISGARIPKGSGIICHIGAANRDERQFNNPDIFDIDRIDHEHIGFGYGRHYCAGSYLAKLEAEVAVNALLDRLPDLQLDRSKTSRIIGFSFRGPDSLPVTFKGA